MSERKGVLSGLRVLEMSAIGPVPFAGMMLADMGAEEWLEELEAAGVVGRACGVQQDTGIPATRGGRGIPSTHV